MPGEHRLIFYNNCWRSKTSTLFGQPAQTSAAKEHRPAYAEDGDYFSKPLRKIFECVYEMMHENDPINSLHFNFKRQKP